MIRFALALAATFFASQSSACLVAADSRPNIVFILADDLGYGDVGCFGRKDVHTPAIDRLAREGVRFTSHYSNGAECTPTRAALLTGLYPQRIGGLECAIGIGDVGRYDEAQALSERGELGLPTRFVTLPRLMKEAGYATCLSGKWHLGYRDKFSPLAHGFDRAFECVGGGMDYFHYTDNLGNDNLRINGRYAKRTGYFTDLVSNHAVGFIETHREQPFFLYVAYTAPHSPFQGPQDYSPAPLPPDSPRWPQGNAPADVYVSMINQLDRGIALILNTLDDLGLASNTLVIFTSDNGGTRSARNEPLSGHKGSTHEGGIRVPAVARWPGKLPAGRDIDIPCLTFDFSRSIVRAAGVEPKTFAHFDGIDILRHVSEGTTPERRMLFWRRPRGKTITKAARDGDLKYVARQQGDKTEEFLFDIDADIAETRDLKHERPDAFQSLRAAYLKWEQTVRKDIPARIPALGE